MRRGHVPLRTCRGCGVKQPQQALQRFVYRQGKLVESENALGRGVYCCRDEACWKRLLNNKKILKRAFRLKD